MLLVMRSELGAATIRMMDQIPPRSVPDSCHFKRLNGASRAHLRPRGPAHRPSVMLFLDALAEIRQAFRIHHYLQRFVSASESAPIRWSEYWSH